MSQNKKNKKAGEKDKEEKWSWEHYLCRDR